MNAGTNANELLLAWTLAASAARRCLFLRLIGFFSGWFQFGNRIADNMPGIARSPKMRAGAVLLSRLVQD